METNVMRCRHCGAAWDLEYEYCPQCDRNYSGAVYPAQHTAQEIEDAARVAKEIRDAFQSVSLGDGLSLSQADLEGVYSEKSELIAARANDTEHHWWDVPPSKLAVMGSALSFFDPVGWRFYIPAFMTWTIDEWIREGTSCYDDVIGRMVPLYGSDAEADRRIKALDRAQGLAVLSYLAYFREYSGDADDRARADRVIKYWEQRVGEV